MIRYFHLIEPTAVDRSRDLDCRAIPGTRSVHSVSSVSPTNVTCLHIRELACFCPECMDDNPMLCARKAHVDLWVLNVLQPLTPIPVSCLTLCTVSFIFALSCGILGHSCSGIVCASESSGVIFGEHGQGAGAPVLGPCGYLRIRCESKQLFISCMLETNNYGDKK